MQKAYLLGSKLLLVFTIMTILAAKKSLRNLGTRIFTTLCKINFQSKQVNQIRRLLINGRVWYSFLN